jgi:hypothetical protein
MRSVLILVVQEIDDTDLGIAKERSKSCESI